MEPVLGHQRTRDARKIALHRHALRLIRITTPMNLKAPILAIMLSLVATSTWAAERGYFGLATSVDGDGFFLNPTLRTVKVEKVVANSPAAKAGIVPGDYIVEVEGKPVAGTKANDLKPYMQREVGQSTRIAVKKATGEIVKIVLVAGPKPQSE